MAKNPRWYGVAAIPNLCSICGKFRSWDDLETHFVPDSDFSSEDESWRECRFCLDARRGAEAQEG